MRRDDKPTKPMESWESWPLWAMGLSNGLNIVLWYVLSMARVEAPELPVRVFSAVGVWLPLIAVAGGIAQALALDGALIATIAGARHGRRGMWTWLTIVGAGVFSAAISYAVHSGRIDQLPLLHVASAINLVLYNLHLSQTKKDLQSDKNAQNHDDARSDSAKPALVVAKSKSYDDVTTTVKLLTCRACGLHGFHTLADVNKHRREECQGRAI
jgi:hypothetical protein